MRNDLEIRTEDAVLKTALEYWWQSYAEKCPEGHFVLTDLDSFSPLNEPGELTFSAKKFADLNRPFSFEELERRFGEKKAGGKRLIKREEAFYLDGDPLCLSPLEERILTVLFERSTPISADELSRTLWGECRSSNQISVYIRYLRKKTDLPGRPQLILTAHRQGYYLKND